MITKLDRRHGGDDLRDDIADRFHPRMHAHLIEALDLHAGQLRRAATASTSRKGPTPQ